MPNKDYLKLRNCPFCGGEADHEIFTDGFRMWCRAGCKECGVELTVPYITGKEAAEAWNRRVSGD